MKKPTLTLVGAGPGDEELITLKGIRAIESADVILYDALANENLLKYAKDECEIVFVGKRAGLHHFQQFKINKLIVEKANEFGHVVRLKGGDPFIFGRGKEEMDYASGHGLEVNLVPGVSSATSVPAMQNIPLTKRGVNESFWVITGTTVQSGFSKDMALAAQSSASIVILMGMKQLKKIISLFSLYRGTKESIGIIQNGTKSNEKVVIGSLLDIELKVKVQNVGAPAIIIIGEVVKERNKNIVNEVMSSIDVT